MRENKYDEELFFSKYISFPRSVHGLSAAGEWHAFQKLLPDFAGKRVLDIGCGLGWHCAYAAEHGAASALGIDISEKMLSVAMGKWVYPNVAFSRMAMEDMDFQKDSFDVVIRACFKRHKGCIIKRARQRCKPDARKRETFWRACRSELPHAGRA